MTTPGGLGTLPGMAETSAPRRAQERGGPQGSESEHKGLAETFHEKVIALDTMGLRLLTPTAIAIAIIVASAVLLATRDADWPLVSMGNVGGSVLETVPLPVAVLATITLILAWSFIVGGALHAHPVLRIVAVGTYAFVGFSGGIETGSFVTALIVTLAVLSVVAVAIGLYATDRGNHRQAPHLHHRARLRLSTFGWILFATTLIYVLFALNGLGNGSLVGYVGAELLAFQFLLIPVLLLAGTDFAEWAEVVSGRLSSLVERLPRRALVGAIAVTGLGILARAYVFRAGAGFSVAGTLQNLAPVAALAVPVCGVAVVALRRPTSTRIPFWALAAGAVGIYLGILVAGIVAPSTFASFSAPDLPPLAAAESAHPQYSLLVPHAWTKTAVHQGATWSGSSDGRPARLVLLWSPSANDRALSSAFAAPARTEPEGVSDGWRSGSVATTVGGRPADGEFWTKREGAVTWTLAGVRVGGTSRGSRYLFETIRGSFTAGSGAPAESSSSDSPESLLLWEGAAGLVLIGVGLILLLAGRGETATGGLFLVLVGLFALAGSLVLPTVSRLIGLSRVLDVVPFNVSVGGAYGALGLILVTSILPGRRLPLPILRLVLVLTLGFAALEFLFASVFGTALDAGKRFTVLQAVVLVVAMLWDVLMSGESFTNTGGLAVPRHTRVLLYMGYTLLVVSAVLFLSSVQIQGGGSAGQEFESDSWPQTGIATLGPPLLITFFLVNLAAWRRSRPLPRPDALDQVDRSMLAETELEGVGGG